MSLDLSPITQDALSVIVQNYNALVGSARAINDTDYSFGVPTRNLAADDPRTTFLLVTPLNFSSTAGRTRILYNRIDLTPLAPAQVYLSAGMTTVASVIPQINDSYGILLVAADYVNEPLGEVGVVSEVTLRDASLLFVGTLRYILNATA